MSMCWFIVRSMVYNETLRQLPTIKRAAVGFLLSRRASLLGHETTRQRIGNYTWQWHPGILSPRPELPTREDETQDDSEIGGTWVLWEPPAQCTVTVTEQPVPPTPSCALLLVGLAIMARRDSTKTIARANWNKPICDLLVIAKRNPQSERKSATVGSMDSRANEYR